MKDIKDMGLMFRNLIQHSDGTWSCRIMTPIKKKHRYIDEFWAETPEEAIRLAKEFVNSFDE